MKQNSFDSFCILPPLTPNVQGWGLSPKSPVRRKEERVMWQHPAFTGRHWLSLPLRIVRENTGVSYPRGCHLAVCSGTVLSAPESGPSHESSLWGRSEERAWDQGLSLDWGVEREAWPHSLWARTMDRNWFGRRTRRSRVKSGFAVTTSNVSVLETVKMWACWRKQIWIHKSEFSLENEEIIKSSM